MEIELNIPRGQRQQEFIDYFNSELRKWANSYSWSSGVNKEGLFESSVTAPLLINSESNQLTWWITKNSDGKLLNLMVEAADNNVSEHIWEKAAYEFVTSVLSKTLSEKRLHFFRQSIFYYIGPQLDGEYWLPDYRFAPAFPKDPQPQMLNAERVLSIDQDIDAIDDYNASALANEAARRHAARLSLLMNTGFYGPQNGLRWIYPILQEKVATESTRCALGFIHPDLYLKQMPKKGEKCPLGDYNGTLMARGYVAGKLKSLPPETRKILRGMDSAEPFVVDAFDRAARLYQVATVCGRYFPSVELAYRVAAVDAISKADRECKGFPDFMRKYVLSEKDIESKLEYLWGNARSAHFHSGQFPMGEFDRISWFDPLMDPEAVDLDYLHRTCFELTREAIVNWLRKLVPEGSLSDSE